MEVGAEEKSAERAELHFLAALVDELERALLAAGVLTREQLQDIENAASSRTGVPPRNW